MDAKRVNRMWAISLFMVGIATMTLAGYSLVGVKHFAYCKHAKVNGQRSVVENYGK